MIRSFTRREILVSTCLASGLVLSASAIRAQPLSCSEVVVGTWGGDYEGLLVANPEKRLTGAHKIGVTHDVANASPRKTKLLSERSAPKFA